ncbi:hypothetical protein [uncultured Sulfitobacter sp.]|uniref:hypothetical protein n=1 Tax=uncultured Sulfitobacter sp. TaxID=191468 RepID=UPI002614798E|nr:hypothetical protein [uncultured Sulfitobacter sp.]
MHYEYAVEPAAIAEDWKTCRYLAELFGFDRGRLLSQFPKKWLPMAIEAAADLPPVEKKRVIEKLRLLKAHASVRAGRPYDPDGGTWLDNAVREHAAAPFRAIVARDTVSGVPEVVAVDDVSETHPLFEVVRSISVPREAASITSAVAPLLSCARHVLLVDKYYDPFNAKYQRTLRELLNHIRGAEIDFQIHYCEHGHCPDAAAIEREAVRKFGGVIPVGMKIKVLRWRQKTGGLNFHARYLLTDRGGIGIDAGFSSEGGGERTDVHLLEGRFTLDTMTHFESSASVFERVGPVLEIDENGRVRHL